MRIWNDDTLTFIGGRTILAPGTLRFHNWNPSQVPACNQRSVRVRFPSRFTWEMAPEDRPPVPDSSLELLRLARGGDRAALDALFARNFPLLRRWARGRLPQWARSIAETADLVQDVMLHSFRRLDRIDIRRKGALQAYLRQSIHNRIKDEFRSAARQRPHDPLCETIPDRGPSPLRTAIDSELRERYTEALAQLPLRDQELVVGRLELEYNYEQLAVATGRRSAEAARIALRRALLRLTDEMRDG